ncbi:MAG: metal ABC transporter substrate-binding protein [Actinomycetota bacterium]
MPSIRRRWAASHDRWSKVALVLAAIVIYSTGCSRAPAPAGITVVTTVAPIADIVRTVTGSNARVIGLIPEGTDSHTFEPSPVTARSLSQADVVFINGMHLEDPTTRLARADMKPKARIVSLGERTIAPKDYEFDFTFPKEKGEPNPHLWMDPTLAKRYAEIVAATMSSIDPKHAFLYRSRTASFAKKLAVLDEATRRCIESIPPDTRKLLTYHDSFAYFSRRYGIPVIAAVQQSDMSEPSPREVASLIDQIKASHVRAIFGSVAFSSKVLEEIATESGARYVGSLSDDVLPGPIGSKDHTYLGMMINDVKILTTSLGGDPSPLEQSGL